MRSVQRTPLRGPAAAPRRLSVRPRAVAAGLGVPPGLLRDVAAMAAACAVVGASFGALATAAGVPLPLVVGSSVLVFAGGSQFLAVGIVASGGGVVAAVLAGLLLNARHLPFGLAVADAFDRGPLTRLLGSHLMTDESVAFAMAQTDRSLRGRAYWLSGATLFGAWNAATVVGALAGRAMGDPAQLGIDAAFPAGLLALLLPAVRERRALRVAIGGAVLALAATAFVPPGLPVLVALLALALAAPVPGRKREVTS